MGRPRKHQSNLPPCYFESHGAYYHVKRGVWRLVGKSIADVAADYAKQVVPVGAEHQLDPLIDGVLARMCKRKSDPLSDSTKDAYSRAAVKLKHLLRQFGRPDQVKQKDAAQVKVLLADTPGIANRVVTFGRLVWNEFLEHQLVDENPFVAIKRIRMHARTRNYTWEEWNAIRAKAGPLLQLVMDGLYLLDQRIGDVLKLDERDLLEQGVYVKQQKTGKELIIGWNDDIREWVAACRGPRHSGNVAYMVYFAPNADGARPLLCNRSGRPPAYETVGGWWRKACAAAGVEDGHLHDGRAFSATEAKRQGHDPQALLGHESAAQTKTYLRGREIEVVQGPRIRRQIGAL